MEGLSVAYDWLHIWFVVKFRFESVWLGTRSLTMALHHLSTPPSPIASEKLECELAMPHAPTP